MPCTIGPCGAYEDYEAMRQQHRTIDSLTRMLCEAMGIIDAHGLDGHVSRQAKAWWIEHQDSDRRRQESDRKRQEAREKRRRLRSQAMAKLSVEERQALGLNAPSEEDEHEVTE